jgi:ribonuclease VapC
MTVMFADASALTAILLNESDAHELTTRLRAYPRRVTSPMAVWETAIAVHRAHRVSIDEAESAVESLLRAVKIEVEPIAPEVRRVAIAAFARFGKGRHPAALNFGDCFAYACARRAGMPLLYKGDDFSRTDIEAA